MTIQKPTTDERGVESHPAYAMIHASRVSGSPRSVFDSEIKHNHTVRIVIETATRERDLNRDWIHGRKQLVEVELSEAQWASFVSSMNTSGVPATLRWFKDQGQIPGFPHEPRMAQSVAEVRGAADKAFEKVKAALADYEEAVASKAGAKVVRQKLANLHHAVNNTGPNMEFAAESLNEHVENVVQKARADVEAMVVSHAAQLGLDAGEASKILELPVLDAPKAVEA